MMMKICHDDVDENWFCNFLPPFHVCIAIVYGWVCCITARRWISLEHACVFVAVLAFCAIF